MAMKARYSVIDGEIIAEKRDGVRKMYMPDPLGSTRALLDSSQTKTDTMNYWPYGEIRTRTGSTETPFLYAGLQGYFSDSTSLVYARARELSIRWARWTCKDPYFPLRRAFAYAGNNPVSFADPTGLDEYSECIRDALSKMLTFREACILCQQKVNRKKKEQALRMCAHLPSSRLGPRPPGIVPKPGGGHYDSPPPIVDWLIGVCSGFLPPGADVMIGAPGAAKDALCIKALSNLDTLWKKYCALDEGSPGRGDWPNTPPEYWDNYCAYLQYAINEWKSFCAPSEGERS